MPRLVVLPLGGESAYFAGLKEQRRKIAEVYVAENVTVKDMMKRFHVSRNTVNAALKEQGIPIDRLRNRVEAGVTYTQWRCLCGKLHRCYHDGQDMPEEPEQVISDEVSAAALAQAKAEHPEWFRK